MKRTTAAAMLALAIAACQQEDPNNIAIDEGNSLNADVEILPPDETMSNEVGESGNETMPASSDAASAVIPAQFHGRWGMVPNDCQPGRDDAKGLIEIGDKTIRFYEAVATLKERRPAVATSYSAQFAFTGEGQNWDKVMTFTRTGNELRRAEEEGTFTYTRCA